MTVKLIPVGIFQIEPGETPETVRQSLMQCWGLHFTSSIQETTTGRFLPNDEKLIDGREYYINFTSIPT